MKDLTGLLDAQDMEALSLAAPKAALTSVVDEIDTAFKQTQGSGLTQEITALDERRDRAITGLKSLTDSYQRHYNDATVQAAKALNNNILSYGERIQRLSYQEETAVIDSIVKDWETKQELQDAVATLALGDWLAELKQSNAAFSTKYLQRVGEVASHSPANIPALREQATQTYRTLVAHIQAHATLGDGEAYTTLLGQIDILAGQYNRMFDNRTGGVGGGTVQEELPDGNEQDLDDPIV